MNKILKTNEAISIAKNLRGQDKSIVLVGGFFDILHLGHIKFLQKAKEKGEVLIVLLESDETAKKTKGENRPINNQEARAEILSSLTSVDFVIKLKHMKSDRDYDNLVKAILPDILAVTKDDLFIEHKKRQADMIGANVITVIPRISNQSTSRLAKIIEEEFEL